MSPWHDIPLFAGKGTYNFVAEIPKNSSAKFESATKESYTPIKQDVKKGKLRFYPYDITWNYGFLPQTWEDPSHKNEATSALVRCAPLNGWGDDDGKARRGAWVVIRRRGRGPSGTFSGSSAGRPRTGVSMRSR